MAAHFFDLKNSFNIFFLFGMVFLSRIASMWTYLGCWCCAEPEAEAECCCSAHDDDDDVIVVVLAKHKKNLFSSYLNFQDLYFFIFIFHSLTQLPSSFLQH